MAYLQIDNDKFTRKDYLELPEGFPAELVDGGLVKRPAPTRWHQRLVGELAIRLRDVAGAGRVLTAPTDVFVDDWNVFQPDVLVYAPEDAVVGPEAPSGVIPLLAVEVLSPSTAARDREKKTAIYLRAGVREVWLVDPDAHAIEVHAAAGVRRLAPAEFAESTAVPGFRRSWGALSGGG